MGTVEEKITEAELEVMEVLWRGEGPMSLTEIKGALPEKNGDTTKTLLRRLCAKGAVGQEKDGVFRYRPLVSRDELGKYKTRRLIDKLYAGSARDLVASLVEHEHLDREDVAELRDLFDRLWEGEGGGGT